MIDLKDKIILVVGASSGIGERTAVVLAEQGARVILLARRETKLIDVCRNIGEDKASYYLCDVSEIESIEPVDEDGTVDLSDAKMHIFSRGEQRVEIKDEKLFGYFVN